jgi:hypothetical protein
MEGSTMQVRQLLTLSGLASVILLVIAYAGLTQSTPEAGEGGAVIKAFYVDHGSREQAAAYLVALAMPLLIFFAAAVRATLVESSGGKSTIWHSIFLGGALIAAAGFLIAACFHLALTSSPEDLSASSVQALDALDSESWIGFTGGLGVMLLGAAGAMLPARSGVRWLGWIALVLGVLIFTPVGFFAFIGSGLWIALTSVALTMRLRAQPAGLREHVVTS